MIKKLLIGLVLVIGVVFVLALLQPPETTTSREILIAVPEAELFPYINNAKKSYDWMPWAENDPGVKVIFSGPEDGVGAMSSWSGKEMGVGTSEVIDSIPNRSVKTRLVYTKPFEMSQLAEVSLTPSNGGTLVKWSVSGRSNFFFRFLGVFIDCDEMIGGEFDKGLKKLKSLAEHK
jgi:hypothetical protein